MASDPTRPSEPFTDYEHYQFVEPQQSCWVPISRDHEVSTALLAEAGLSWYGMKAIADRFDAQMRAVQAAPPIPAGRFAELREAALRMGQEVSET